MRKRSRERRRPWRRARSEGEETEEEGEEEGAAAHFTSLTLIPPPERKEDGEMRARECASSTQARTAALMKTWVL